MKTIFGSTGLCFVLVFCFGLRGICEEPSLPKPPVLDAPITTLDQLTAVKEAAGKKLEEAKKDAQNDYEDEMGDIRQESEPQIRRAYHFLKEEDPAAASYWIERQVFSFATRKDPKPTSDAYDDFLHLVESIEEKYHQRKKDAYADKAQAYKKAMGEHRNLVIIANESYLKNKPNDS